MRSRDLLGPALALVVAMGCSRAASDATAETSTPSIASQSLTLEGDAGVPEAPLSFSPYIQFYAAVATDGANSLVVWMDEGPDQNFDLYAVRVSATGQSLDPPIRVTHSPRLSWNSSVAVAWSGSSYLVVWGTESGSAVRGARITADGTLLDPNGFEVMRPPTPFDGDSLAVASDGNGFLVALNLGSELRSVRLGLDGTRVAGTVETLSVAAGGQFDDSAISANPSGGYLLVWQVFAGGNFQLVARPVPSDPLASLPDPIRLSTFEDVVWSVAASWVNDAHLVAFGASDIGVGALRVTSDGTVGPVESVDTAASNTGPISIQIAAATGGALLAYSRYLSSGSDDQALYLQRLDPLGESSGPATHLTTIANVRARVRLAATASGSLLVYANASKHSPRVEALRLDPTGQPTPGSPFLLTPTAAAQRRPSLARGADGTLLVWEEGRLGTSSDVLAARVDTTGNIVDQTALAVASSAADESSASVAWTGTGYFVVWEARARYVRSIEGRMVETDGTMGPSFTLSGPGDHVRPQVIRTGSSLLVAWSSSVAGGSQIVARFFTRDGVPLTAEIPIGAVTPYAASKIPLAWSGSQALILSDQGTATGVRISSSGQVFDSPPLVFGVGRPDGVVWNGGSFSLTHWDGTSRWLSGLSETGVQLPATEMAFAVGEGRVAAMEWDGSRHVVIWVEDRQLRAARVSRSGAVIGSSGETLIHADVVPDLAIVRNAQNELLVAHSLYRDGSVALRVRRLSTRTPPPSTVPLTLELDQDASLAFTVSGSDPEGEEIWFDVARPPSNGVLTGTAPDLVYTPRSNFFGDDSFEFSVTDGEHVVVQLVPITVRAIAKDDLQPEPKASGCGAAGSGSLSALALLALAGGMRRRSVDRPQRRDTHLH